MIRLIALSLVVFLSLPALSQQSKDHTLKPRIVVLTDVSTWETDDSESLVRLMAHADLFEIEALIFTTGWSLDKTREDFMDLIHILLHYNSFNIFTLGNNFEKRRLSKKGELAET
jgi:hypothetical protein